MPTDVLIGLSKGCLSVLVTRSVFAVNQIYCGASCFMSWLFASHGCFHPTAGGARHRLLLRGFGLVLLLPVLFCGLPASTILRLRGVWGSCWSRDSAGCCGGKSGPKIGANRPLRAAADELLHLQLIACSLQSHVADLYDCQGGMPAVLYAWASRCSYYVGIASVERKRKRATPGPACRWLEHMCGMLRTHTTDSQKLRYKLMRRFRPEDTVFLICRAASYQAHGDFGGPLATLDVPTNRVRPKLCLVSVTGPQKHCRAGLSHGGPFDSVVVACSSELLSAPFS